MNSNMSRAVGAAMVLAIVAAACGGGDDDSADTTTTTESTTTTTSSTTTTTTSTTTSTTTTTIPEPVEPPRQPLTGEPVDSEDDIETRPALAVKIDNAPGARANHSGFSDADLVFEEIVEAQITRFAMVFQTRDADPVGPIRSGRTQDVDLLSSLNEPLFAWSGGNAGVTRIIAESFLTDLNPSRGSNSSAYYRGAGRAPHNFYSSTEALYALTPEDHPGAPDQQFAYVRSDEEFGGRGVASVDLDMRAIDVQWDWNAETSEWDRSQEGGPHVEADGDRLTATNVIVMVVPYRPSSVDARSPEAQTLGEGLAYVFSNGRVVEARWSRELAVAPIELTDTDGNPILLTPGRTWIELAELDESAAPGESQVAMTIDDAPDRDAPVTTRPLADVEDETETASTDVDVADSSDTESDTDTDG